MFRRNRRLTSPIAAARDSWLVREEAIMGTAVRVELRHDDRDAARAAADAVIEEMHRIDGLMSPFKPESELSRVNREAAARAVVIGREMFELVARALEFSARSDGVFDITFASVGRFYDYRGGVRPSDAEIAAALPALDYRHVVLDPAKLTIRFAHPGVQIDLGGIAKGHAVDNCVALLKGRGVTAATVSAGGDSRMLGSRDGRPWIVGIRDPRHAERVVAKIPIVDAAMSTSGDYERYFEEHGVRHHHILDPRTGKSAARVRSATIIGPDATTTECVSKVVFIRGVPEGLRFAESIAGVDAVVVDAEGRLHFSQGLQRQG